MAEIKEYNATGDVTPDDKGIEAAVRVAGRVGQFGHQIQGDVDQIAANLKQHEVTMDASTVYARSTTLEQNLQDASNAFFADPKNAPLVANGTAAKVFMDQAVDGALQDSFADIKSPEGQRLAAEEMARVRNNIFTHVASTQAVQSAGIWKANTEQATANQVASATTDPSDANIDQQIDLARTRALALPAGINGELRANAQLQGTADIQRIVSAAYDGRIDAVRKEVAKTGQTGTAYDALSKAIAGQDHFQYLAPDVIPELPAKLEEAVDKGRTEFNANKNMNDKALEDQGKGIEAQLDARVQAQLRPGAQPDPSLADDIGKFTGQYGSLLPGESAALQAGLTKIASPETARALVPDNTPTATAMIGSLGTDHAPTEVQISQAEHANLISSFTASTLRDGIRIEADPANHEALAALHKAQDDAAQAILKSANGNPYGAIVVNQMRSDSQATFNGWVRTEGPARAVEIMNDGNNPRNFFSHMMSDYISAAQNSSNGNVMSTLMGMKDYATYYANEHGTAPPASAGGKGASDGMTDAEIAAKFGGN